MNKNKTKIMFSVKLKTIHQKIFLQKSYLRKISDSNKKEIIVLYHLRILDFFTDVEFKTQEIRCHNEFNPRLDIINPLLLTTNFRFFAT